MKQSQSCCVSRDDTSNIHIFLVQHSTCFFFFFFYPIITNSFTRIMISVISPLFAISLWNMITNISYHLDHVSICFELIQALCYCSSDCGSDYWLFCRPRPSLTGRLRFFWTLSNKQKLLGSMFEEVNTHYSWASLILFKSLLDHFSA